MEAQKQIDARWWDGIENGKILYQRCGRCAAPNFYPRLACKDCLSRDLEWQECNGQGTIYACTRVHRAPGKEHAAEAPYTVIMADMDDGFRLMAKLKKNGGTEAAIGARVQAYVDVAEDGRPYPCFML